MFHHYGLFIVRACARRILLAAIVAVALSCFSCGFIMNPQADGSRSAIQALSVKAVVLDVPFKGQEEDYLCGISAINMLFDYYGVKSVPSIEDEYLAVAKEFAGLTVLQVKELLVKHGLMVFVMNGTISNEEDGKADNLFTHIMKKRPVIVLIRTSSGRNHFVMVSGYDPLTESVIYVDPSKGNRVLSLSKFNELWGPTNRIAVLAVPVAEIRPIQ